jgi:hypothetical protein
VWGDVSSAGCDEAREEEVDVDEGGWEDELDRLRLLVTVTEALL